MRREGADLKHEGPNLRPERPDLRIEGGQTDEWMIQRRFVSFGAVAHKAAVSISKLAVDDC